MKKLKHLFDQNAAWADQVRAESPGFFETLAAQQAPRYLWIGCSDSRVPANEIVGLLPGELFVHRNVSNIVVHSDMNCLSVLQYAVEVLGVKNVMVVGHYGCGGVKASMEESRHGLIDNWLTHIRDVYYKHKAVIGPWRAEPEQIDKLCEFNVIEQGFNVCNTTIVQDAWARGQDLSIHAWIYGLHNGNIQDLGFCISSRSEAREIYEASAEYIATKKL